MAAELLQTIVEAAWLSEAFPEKWKEGIIVKIPKKGNQKICEETCLARNLQNHLQGHIGSAKRPSIFHHRS